MTTESFFNCTVFNQICTDNAIFPIRNYLLSHGVIKWIKLIQCFQDNLFYSLGKCVSMSKFKKLINMNYLDKSLSKKWHLSRMSHCHTLLIAMNNDQMSINKDCFLMLFVLFQFQLCKMRNNQESWKGGFQSQEYNLFGNFYSIGIPDTVLETLG